MRIIEDIINSLAINKLFLIAVSELLTSLLI